jgi:TRAP transporter TAXI family solute receptor
MKDFKGKRLPTEYQAQRIISVMLNGELANGGLSYADVQGVPVPNVQRGADEFAAGRADGFHFALGAAKVMETNAKVALRAVSLDPSPEAVAAMKKFVPVAYVARIEPSPANVGVIEPTNVMAYDYLTLTNAKVPDDVVYKLTKAMYGGRDVMKATFAPLAGFAQDKMAKDLGGVSYHPGAIKFYQEQGLWPPRS